MSEEILSDDENKRTFQNIVSLKSLDEGVIYLDRLSENLDPKDNKLTKLLQSYTEGIKLAINVIKEADVKIYDSSIEAQGKFGIKNAKFSEELFLKTFEKVVNTIRPLELRLVQQLDNIESLKSLNKLKGLSYIKDIGRNLLSLFPPSLSAIVESPILLQIVGKNAISLGGKVTIYNFFQELSKPVNRELLTNPEVILEISRTIGTSFNGYRNLNDSILLHYHLQYIKSFDGTEKIEEGDLITLSKVNPLYSKGISLYLIALATNLGSQEVDVNIAFKSYMHLRNRIALFDSAFVNGLTAASYIKSQNLVQYFKNVIENIDTIEDANLKEEVYEIVKLWEEFAIKGSRILYLYQNEIEHDLKDFVIPERKYKNDLNDSAILDKLKDIKVLPDIVFKDHEDMPSHYGPIEEIRTVRHADEDIYEVRISFKSPDDYNDFGDERISRSYKEEADLKFLRATIDMQNPNNPFVLVHLLDENINPSLSRLVYELFMDGCTEMLLLNSHLLKEKQESKPKNTTPYISKHKIDTSVVKPRKSLDLEVEETIEAKRVLDSDPRHNKIIVDPELELDKTFLDMIETYENTKGASGIKIKKIPYTNINMWELKVKGVKDRVFLEMMETEQGKRFVCIGYSRTPQEQRQFIAKYR
jgi:hypothetical protein